MPDEFKNEDEDYYAITVPGQHTVDIFLLEYSILQDSLQSRVGGKTGDAGC